MTMMNNDIDIIMMMNSDDDEWMISVVAL